MRLAGLLAGMLLVLATAGCTPHEQAERQGRRLQVVASLFPLYDMARAIGGEFTDVTLLLPPGAEAHSFEPRPGDILRLNRADLFIYTGRFMEPWAESLVRGVDPGNLLVVNAGSGIPVLKGDGGHDDGHDHDGVMDPHIWLDFDNARAMVKTILAGFASRDPRHAADYRRNAAAYESQLVELDRAYRAGLADCGTRTVIHGGHFAFGYLARRYDLTYVTAFPPSGDSEPNARQMAKMVGLIRSTGAGFLFHEELVSPRFADTLAREAGVRLLMLNAAHNVGRESLAQGITFPAIMEQNLKNLREGLKCR